MRAVALFASLFIGVSAHAADLVLTPVAVAPDTYAVIGDLGGQTYENDGLNNNLGFIVTDAGVVVINTGPTARVAKALHAAIQKVTPQAGEMGGQRQQPEPLPPQTGTATAISRHWAPRSSRTRRPIA